MSLLTSVLLIPNFNYFCIFQVTSTEPKTKLIFRPLGTFQERVVRCVLKLPGPHLRVKRLRMIFFKIYPSCVDLELGNHCEVLRTAGVSLAEYEKTFSDRSNMDTTLTTYCWNSHPQSELIYILSDKRTQEIPVSLQYCTVNFLNCLKHTYLKVVSITKN